MKGRDCIDFQIIQVDRLKNSTKSKILLYCISVKKDVPYKQINKHYQLSFCDSFLQQCQISSNGHHSEGYEDWLRLGVSFSPISTVASTQEMKSIFWNLICHLFIICVWSLLNKSFTSPVWFATTMCFCDYEFIHHWIFICTAFFLTLVIIITGQGQFSLHTNFITRKYVNKGCLKKREIPFFWDTLYISDVFDWFSISQIL